MAPKRQRNQCDSDDEDDRLPVSYGSVTQSLPRPATFEQARYMIKSFFPTVTADFSSLKFFAKLKTPTSSVESDFKPIPTDLWEFLAFQMTALRFEGPAKPPAAAAATNSQKPVVNITVVGSNGRSFLFRISLDELAAKLMKAAEARFGLDEGSGRFLVGDSGRRLNPSRSLRQHDIEDGEEITLDIQQRGGKPVVYLFPPCPMEISVELALVPEWTFDAVYPVTAITEDRRPGMNKPLQRIQWDVNASPSGEMTMKDSGLEVSYLFWEAIAAVSLIKESTGSLPQDHFVPTQSDCLPQDSVILPIEKIPSYLDRALLALGLHTEARTSFITYWLPSLQKHAHVALRFVPQVAFEKAAPLSVQPRPDIVTRVFMLFQGIASKQLSHWKDSLPTTTPEMWTSVVGTNAQKQNDPTLFRVLEWGGMEVKR